MRELNKTAIIRPIVGWMYEGAMLTPAQAEERFGAKLWGFNRPAGLVPVFDTIGKAVAAA